MCFAEYRPDMEPPDDCEQNYIRKIKFRDKHDRYLFICSSTCKLLAAKKTTFILRVRGGVGEPNVDRRANEVPYLTNIKFMWNGLPCIDFQELVMNPLDNGLGSITVNGATLLETVRMTDPGGVLGMEPEALAACWCGLDATPGRPRGARAGAPGDRPQGHRGSGLRAARRRGALGAPKLTSCT